eukprot:508650-Amorphochlora_amoeboformis.AAC.1
MLSPRALELIVRSGIGKFSENPPRDTRVFRSGAEDLDGLAWRLGLGLATELGFKYMNLSATSPSLREIRGTWLRIFKIKTCPLTLARTPHPKIPPCGVRGRIWESGAE